MCYTVGDYIHYVPTVGLSALHSAILHVVAEGNEEKRLSELTNAFPTVLPVSKRETEVGYYSYSLYAKHGVAVVFGKSQ